MLYHSPIGFSFELPEGWQNIVPIEPLSFCGPQGQIGGQTEVIQLKVNVLPVEYHSPEARASPIFWGEQDVEVRRSNLGGEANVVVLRRLTSNEISAVHEGVHYNITHSTDDNTINAIARLSATFTFPSIEDAQRVVGRIRGMSAQQTEDRDEMDEITALGEAIESGQLHATIRDKLQKEFKERTASKTSSPVGQGTGAGCSLAILLVLFALLAAVILVIS